jgi:hypothetical protein
MKTLAVVVLTLAAACSKKDGGASGGNASGSACASLSITVDGTPLPALPHGLARAVNADGHVHYEVVLFERKTTRCEQLLDKNRQIPDGEISVRAFAGGTGLAGEGVGIGIHTQIGGPVSLVGDKPKAAGDVVRVCVDKASFKPIMGDYKDKHVVVAGLFEGTYCGEMTL